MGKLFLTEGKFQFLAAFKALTYQYRFLKLIQFQV